MPDVETSDTMGALRNPYSGLPEPHVLPATHPFNILKRSGIIGGCLYGLHRWNVYHNVLHSPDVRHEWFKMGLAASVAILAIKTYVELYAGKLKKQKVNYANFRNSTHAVIGLILLASFSFHVALWPVYGANTLVIMLMLGFGILLQIALLLPTYVQNILGAVLMTFFIQEYV